MAFGRPKNEDPSKVYTYGLLPPTTNADLVDEQIWLAHRYRNKLVEIELKRRGDVKAAMARLRPAIAETEQRVAELEEQIVALRAAVSRHNAANRSRKKTPPAERAKIREMSSIKKSVKADLRLMRSECREASDVLLAIEAVNSVAHDAVLAARAETKLFWGTYLLVEATVNHKGRPPKFRRWHPNGRVSVQTQISQPLAAEAVPGTDDTRVQVDQVNPDAWNPEVRLGVRRKLRRTKLRLRIGTDKREPIWAEWPMIMHRELPAGSIVKRVTVFRRRLASKFRWEVQFLVAAKNGFAAPAGLSETGAVAIDIGFRLRPNGSVRVAYWADGPPEEGGKHDEFVLPPRMLVDFDQVDELKSIRDLEFTHARDRLVAWLKAAGPNWLAEDASTMAQWRSQARLAALLIRWRAARFAGDETIFDFAEAWRKKDKHLWEWEANLRDQVLRHRRELYRVFAARLRKEYVTAVIEQIDLRELAEPEDEQKLHATARKNRQRVALSELVTAIKQSGMMVRLAPAEYTTQKCHLCGFVEQFDAAMELVHRCAGCGAVWDQDYNAAMNLLQWYKAGGTASDEVADDPSPALATV